MASSDTNINMTCPMCFGSQDVLKIVGKCKHSFCMMCLTKHLQRQKSRKTKFPCPTCNADYVLPNGGLDGLVDFIGAGDVKGEQRAEPDSSIDPQPGSDGADRGKQPEDLNRLVDVKCQICHHRKLLVQAENLCLDCDQLHLCKTCTAVHARNKATKDHAVVPLKIQATEGEAVCIAHNAPLTKYCSTCGKPTCKICVTLEHGDHDVEKLSDTILRRVQEVKVTFQQKEKEMKKLRGLQTDIAALKIEAPNLDRQDALIKEVEDHAQKHVNQIVTWKDDMKKQIRNEFKIIKEIPAAYEAASNNVKRLEPPLAKAATLLAKTEQHPSYLEKLTSVQQGLEAVAKIASEMEGEKYHKSLRELKQRNPTFCPNALPFAIGKLDIGKLDMKIIDKRFKPEILFSHTMANNSQDKYIPCVANLGKKYAIAHRTIRGQPESAIDIYEFPGKFCHTLTDAVKPVYDMTSTYEGKLAVLSDGNKGTSSSAIKVFEPENGNILSTLDLDIPQPRSLGFGLRNRYVVLSGGGQGKRLITVINANGNVEYRHVIDIQPEPEVINPSRISCGMQRIFVMGENGVAVYEIQGTVLAQTDIISKYIAGAYDFPCIPWDISASLRDQLFLVDRYAPNYNEITICLIKYCKEPNNKQWKAETQDNVWRAASGGNRECRIATNGDHIVLSWGQTFTVWRY